MTPLERAAYTIALLTLDERRTNFLYDDAVGAVPFKQGDTLKGNLTGAVGINFSAGLDDEEVAWLTQHRIAKKQTELMPYAWYSLQDDVRQVALTDLAFNLGLTGLLHWPHFLAFMSDRLYDQAAREIENNQVWIAQVHEARAGRIIYMVATGQPAKI